MHFWRFLLVTCALVLQIRLCNSKPDGAPCGTMMSMWPEPFAHGNQADWEPPYGVLFLNPESQTEPECYRGNRNYLIRIVSADNNPISGFLLQCRDVNDNRFGTFLFGSGNANDWKYHCQRTDSITHQRNDKKNQLNVLWTPNGFAGDFTCKATIVQSTYVWWAKIQSRIMRPCVNEMNRIPMNGPFRRVQQQ